MPQPTQQLDPFSLALMDQRNAAFNEAAYWRAEATRLQAQVTSLEAAKPKPRKPTKEPASGS